MSSISTYISNTIELTDKKARYDNCAKAIMADKQVLARIAKHTTKEFKDYDVPTIMQCIEGNPEIRFNMVTLDEIQIKIILNIELQNEHYESYHFEPR